jgi:hypothetical protein
MDKMLNAEVGRIVGLKGLGMAVDLKIQPQDILDKELASLWADAQVALNAIQLHLEMNGGFSGEK